MAKSLTRRGILAAVCGLALATHAMGQASPEPSFQAPMLLDSGRVVDVGGEGLGGEHVRVWSGTVNVPGAPWMRVHFSTETLLAGPNRHEGGSYLVITSVEDGAKHFLDAETLPEWDHISAFMNGDTLFVELFAVGGMGDNRVKIQEVTAGITMGPESICGTTDDRLPDNDPRAGRISVGCTGWLIHHNGNANEFLTAGHCLTVGQTGAVQMFNVPPATAGGGFVAPPPEFQYSIQSASIQRQDAGVGNDWCRYFTNNNSNHGLPARIAQGRNSFSLASSAPASGTATTTVRGNGVVNNQAGITPVPIQWTRINKVHAGPYAGKTGTRIRYNTDTTPANSGSPVTQIIGTPFAFEQAIGIHTHGGCPSDPNSGTAVEHANLQAALASPAGVARPFDSAVSKGLNTTFNSDNGGSDGGAVYFDVTTGIKSIEVTHFYLNVNRNGTTNNGTTTEDDDFFNFQVYIRQGGAAGFQNTIAAWTKVADGAGMPRFEDSPTLGALKKTFSLAGNTTYGIAIVFDNGAGHAYTNATGSNETYSNADITITGISASNAPFTGNIANRVFNGGVGYLLNASSGQCAETLFSSNNGGSNGGMVYFDTKIGTSSLSLTGLTMNVSGTGGNACNVKLYRTATTYVGKANTPGSWTLAATGTGTSAAQESPTYITLNSPVALTANANYGWAIELTQTSGSGHRYTDSTGLNNVYNHTDVNFTLGAASNTPFGTTINNRVWNGSFCYGKALNPCKNTLTAVQEPSPLFGAFNSNNGLQEEADNFTHATQWSVSGGTFWGTYTNVTVPPLTQNFTIRFFSNSAGLPGALLASRNVNNVQVKNTGLFDTIIGRPIYEFDLAFTPVTLPAGTQWVSIVGTSAGFTWAWDVMDNVGSAHAVRNGVGAWSLSTGNFAFALCGNVFIPCYPDCEEDGDLDIFDFLCFQSEWSAKTPYGDCEKDGDWDVFDFLCYQSAYAGGC